MNQLLKELKSELKTINKCIRTEKEYKEFIRDFYTRYDGLIGSKSGGDRCSHNLYYKNGKAITTIWCVEAYEILHPTWDITKNMLKEVSING